MAVNRVRADIDLDAILYNMESMHKKLKPGTKIAAVVKLRTWCRRNIKGA